MAVNDALLLSFQLGESCNTVSRKTVEVLSERLGLDETQVVLYALARLRDELIPSGLPDAPELSEAAMKMIRAWSNQDGYSPTRSLIPGL